MALVSYSKINIYEPDFDIISGLNIDKCPFIRNSRNNPMYKCLCNNQTFTNFSSSVFLSIKLLCSFVIDSEIFVKYSWRSTA